MGEAKMESKVDVLLKHPVYEPNLDQFRDMKGLLHTIVNDKAFHDAGIAVIKPPIKPSVKRKSTFMLRKCVEQDIEKLAENKVYRWYIKSKCQMTIKEFRIASSKFENETQTSTENMEDQCWDNVELRSTVEIATPIYGLDNEKSLYPENFEPWNLNKISPNVSIIHGKGKIRGVNTPYWNMGMKFTAFGLHLEDSNLGSINQLLSGEKRIWYAIPARYGKKLGEYIQTKAPNDDDDDDCDLIIRHKNTLMAPSALAKEGIPFAKVEQDVGDIVLTPFGAFHQGFNYGENMSEAVNFATDEWIPHFELTQLCTCAYSKGPRKLHKVLGDILAGYEQMGDANEEEANDDESDDENEESDDENEEPPAKREKRPDALIRHDKTDHWPEHDGKNSRSTCKLKGCRFLSNVYCTKCNVHLCFVRGRNCFKQFHVPN